MKKTWPAVKGTIGWLAGKIPRQGLADMTNPPSGDSACLLQVEVNAV
jgi:hypothetical protein